MALLQTTNAAPYRLVHAFAGGAKDGNYPLWGSSLRASGSLLYGVTFRGGAKNWGVLFQTETTGSSLKIIHPFEGYSEVNVSGSKSDGNEPIGTPLLIGSTLYGMTQDGGSNGLGHRLLDQYRRQRLPTSSSLRRPSRGL
ncbi:MAG TPA: choice-of-anchor tandem repeat GloVer-containing protein [Verrucomicrobiae bacterium]|nr:choice-of-anchor tandem repeat GloVer-containing protein [Verrucomicrobiae bacterium]